jgi:hypothetical protein
MTLTLIAWLLYNIFIALCVLYDSVEFSNAKESSRKPLPYDQYFLPLALLFLFLLASSLSLPWIPGWVFIGVFIINLFLYLYPDPISLLMIRVGHGLNIALFLTAWTIGALRFQSFLDRGLLSLF